MSILEAELPVKSSTCRAVLEGWKSDLKRLGGLAQHLRCFGSATQPKGCPNLLMANLVEPLVGSNPPRTEPDK